MIEGKISIDLREFNEELRRQGFDSYPFDEITINAIDAEHLSLSVKNMIDNLAKWWSEQEKRKKA